MGIWLTEKVVRALPLPERGVKRVYDAADPRGKQGWTAGFGVRLSAGGSKSFVLRYRSKETRVEHLYTLGTWPAWSVEAARAEARDLKRRIEQGGDPQREKQHQRDAATVSDLCDRFIAEQLPARRPSTQALYRSAIDNVRPALGRKLVSAVDHSDIEKLHREVTKRAPAMANRVVAVCGRMFAFAVRWKMRPDNPARGIERNAEVKRRRFLTGDELGRLVQALDVHPDQQAANVFRLLLLTGARFGEVASATWSQFDLDHRQVWIKPAASTKQKKDHEVPLGTAALVLLRAMRKVAPADAVHLFSGVGHVRKRSWYAICKRAGIEGLRVHDLRHSYASMLASAGYSLPVIGALLGHAQPATTARYAHLYDSPLREATNRVGALMGGLVAKPTGGKRRKLRAVP